MVQRYPLLQLIEIKQTRVEEAEKIVTECRKNLDREEEKLQKLVDIRNRTQKHYTEKLKELRSGIDTGELKPEKIAHVQDYLKQVNARLKDESNQVAAQQKVRDQAEKSLDDAIAVLKQRRIEVEKLQMHREEWQKGITAEEARLAGIETDDIGTVIHNARRRGHG